MATLAQKKYFFHSLLAVLGAAEYNRHLFSFTTAATAFLLKGILTAGNNKGESYKIHVHVNIFKPVWEFKPGISWHKLTAVAFRMLMPTQILHNLSDMQYVICTYSISILSSFPLICISISLSLISRLNYVLGHCFDAVNQHHWLIGYNCIIRGG